LGNEFNEGSERDTYPHCMYRTNGIRDDPPCASRKVTERW